MRFIDSQCSHGHRHQSIRGTKDSKGGFLRSSSAEYPPALAQALASVFAPKLTSLGHKAPASSRVQPLSPLKDLSNALSSWLQSSGLRASIAAHIIQQKPDCPLSEAQESQALSIITQTLGLGEAASLLEVEPGQPLRLNLLQALATATGDKDTALIPMLKAGVTTGLHEPIPSSLQWPKKSQPYQDFMPLEMCQGNWSAAETKPSIVRSLIDKEVASGWVQHLPGGRTAAQSRRPSATAVGKLSAWQRPPPGSRQYSLPGQSQLQPCRSRAAAHSLSFSFQPSMGASLDFKAAHKQVKVREQDQGMLLFELTGQLYGYTVCHFGARFSAYWWQRTSSPCTTAPQSLALRR